MIFGVATGLRDVHDFFGNTLLVVVLVHIAAVVGLSLLRRKNLVAPMLSGHMDGAGPDLAKRNHLWLAVLLVGRYWRTGRGSGSSRPRV